MNQKQMLKFGLFPAVASLALLSGCSGAATSSQSSAAKIQSSAVSTNAASPAATPINAGRQSKSANAVATSPVISPSKQNGSKMSSASLPVVTGALGAAPAIKIPAGAPSANLEISDLHVGDGANVNPNSTVTVQYTLVTWSDGKVADSSWGRGTPATFGLGQVIPGWQEGLQGMKVGGRRLLVVPPALGYGPNGAGPIKANETLVFVVDLLAIA
jgi:peptidylprolyl isomerase